MGYIRGLLSGFLFAVPSGLLAPAVGLLLVLPACSMFEKGIPGSTVSWKEVPYVAGGNKQQEAYDYTASALKASEDGQYLYLQVHGYSKPAELQNVLVEAGARRFHVDSQVDLWRITLDSDSLIEPRAIIFSPGRDGTVCSDPSVKFAECKGQRILDVAFPIAVIATTPVHVRVEHVIRLIRGGSEVATLNYPFPKRDVAVYHTPNLPFDQRVPPRVLNAGAAEFEAAVAVMRWESNKRISGCIELAPAGEPLRPVCDLEPPRLKHDVRLTRLKPDTLYHYSVTGRDFAGNLAVPINGTFRTAVESPSTEAINGMDVDFIPVKLYPPLDTAMQAIAAEGYSPGSTPRGIAVTTQPAALWKLEREQTAGHYRITMCAWHAPDGEQFKIMAVRSAERPTQFRTVDTIAPERNGKLCQFDKIIKIDTPFDQLVLMTDKSTAGPVTVFRMYELSGKPVQSAELR